MSTTVFRIKIVLENDAMKTVSDVRQALIMLTPSVLRKIANCGEERKVMDANGNSVGTVGFYQE